MALVVFPTLVTKAYWGPWQTSTIKHFFLNPTFARVLNTHVSQLKRQFFCMLAEKNILGAGFVLKECHNCFLPVTLQPCQFPLLDTTNYNCLSYYFLICTSNMSTLDEHFRSESIRNKWFCCELKPTLYWYQVLIITFPTFLNT